MKAYEYEPHKYIILDEKELENLKRTHALRAIHFLSFIQSDEIDPIFFDRSYFVGPTSGSEKAYLLLKEALERTNKLGLVHISLRKKQHLAIVRNFGQGLLLQTIYYSDEIREVENIPNLPKYEEIPIQKQELVAAMNLIHHLTTPFTPKEYTDEYREALLDLIEEKIEHDEKTETIFPSKNIVDIMETLNASIEQIKQKTKPQKRKAK